VSQEQGSYCKVKKRGKVVIGNRRSGRNSSNGIANNRRVWVEGIRLCEDIGGKNPKKQRKREGKENLRKHVKEVHCYKISKEGRRRDDQDQSHPPE